MACRAAGSTAAGLVQGERCMATTAFYYLVEAASWDGP
jgi:hypothetical protein